MPHRDQPEPSVQEACRRPAENVADYPRPPRVERIPWRIRVELEGTVVAETTRALRVLETFGAPVFYVPPEDVRLELLEAEEGGSWCEWKGQARYWTVRVGDRVVRRAAWSYPDPVAAFGVLQDHLAFYAGKMDACWVDGDRARPQPGGFYGGWITPEIQGPIKGAPGTTHW
jgi:uncharacterized protein (DUF427 family)